MPIAVVDAATAASGPVNEDRFGKRGRSAWIIDGATDVVEAPLAGRHSDADWFAGALHDALSAGAAETTQDLAHLPIQLASLLEARFRVAARRLPASRAEHPSAAGLIVRAEAEGLAYVSVGDCTLLTDTRDGVRRFGTREEAAGDAWVVEQLRSERRARAAMTQAEARAALWPKLRAARAFMNMENGYGVFSITAPPAHFVEAGFIKARPGAPILIASDGFMRLVDVFRAHTAASLLEAALARGIAPLIAELREIETGDAECLAFPRAKVSDDATAVLGKLT